MTNDYLTTIIIMIKFGQKMKIVENSDWAIFSAESSRLPESEFYLTEKSFVSPGNKRKKILYFLVFDWLNELNQ